MYMGNSDILVSCGNNQEEDWDETKNKLRT
ncbi:hypothetical protein DFP96_10285 [Listeria rocourtiae]|uniref:Uncharacterized protein n=1 Tax=Listeria rocourtiae TaxID=647910 RepID=A0A4R6ZPK3_9LIST|nr:hypothetical protein DFP96_10285 [Listeria rocourtiae]